jgi:N-acetylneuraminic acid mutarotase
VVGANWNGRVAVMGGLTQDGQASAQVDVYDPAIDTWTRAPDLPIALHHAGAGVLGNRLFVVGGYTGAAWAPQAAVYSLGPEPGATWRVEPPLAGPRGALAVASDGRRLVAVGGVGSGDVRRTEILEEGAGSWRPGPDLAVQREHLGATFAGGRVYAIAGRMESNRDSVESLAPGDASWRTEPKLNDSRGGIGAASPGTGPPAVEAKQSPCVAGGEAPNGTIPTVECLREGAWEVVAELEVPRHGLAVVAVGKRLHIIGGGPQPGLFVSDAHEVFDL